MYLCFSTLELHLHLSPHVYSVAEHLIQPIQGISISQEWGLGMATAPLLSRLWLWSESVWWPSFSSFVFWWYLGDVTQSVWFLSLCTGSNFRPHMGNHLLVSGTCALLLVPAPLLAFSSLLQGGLGTLGCFPFTAKRCWVSMKLCSGPSTWASLSLCHFLVLASCWIWATPGSFPHLLATPWEGKQNSSMLSDLKIYLGFFLEVLTSAQRIWNWDVQDMEGLFLGIHINYSLSCSHFLLLSCNLWNFSLVLERRQWLWWEGENDLFITLQSFQLHCLYNKLWRINLFRPLDPDIQSQTFGTKIIFVSQKSNS